MTDLALSEATDSALQVIGAQHYFHPEMKPRAEALGLDMFRMYIAGRAGVLGPVPSEVVQAAFGYFEPGLIRKLWLSSLERCDPQEAADAHFEVAYSLGESHLGAVDHLAEASEAMATVVENADPAGLGLFAGFAASACPDSPASTYMHQSMTLRELRGSVHLAAVAAAGLPSVIAHAIRRPNDLATFGWTNAPAPSDADREMLAAIDVATRNTMERHYSCLSADQMRLVHDVAQQARATFP